jgi:OOP family OmpA-OmpF porin
MKQKKTDSKSVACIFMIIIAIGFIPANSNAAEGKEYPDGHDGTVFFPLGDLSFADEVVSFEEGDPSSSDDYYSQAEHTLGPPDYDETPDDSYTTLGCGGRLTLRFEDNALVDVEGPDLYVFEIGPDIEATDLSISKDGTEWINIGEISGGKAEVDISIFIKPGEKFYYVRLQDKKLYCSNRWPGADIDAVGAIGSETNEDQGDDENGGGGCFLKILSSKIY